MSKKLTLETLHEFDGGSLAILFNQALRNIYLDLEDRSMLKKARRLSVELMLTPLIDEKSGRADLAEIRMDARISVKIPNKETHTNILAPSSKEGGLMFEPASRHTRTLPGQNSLPLEDAEADSDE